MKKGEQVKERLSGLLIDTGAADLAAHSSTVYSDRTNASP